MDISCIFSYHLHILHTDMRRSHAIRNHEPGPFIDVVGPVTITAILMACIVVQFIVKANELYE
jgi:hypothetical protein